MLATCIVCKEEFEKKRPWQKFCSAKCRYAKWNEKNPKSLANDHSYNSAIGIVNRKMKFGKSTEYFPYRSKLEFLYAEHLADCDIEFEFEKDFFELTDELGVLCRYVPDFYLPERDEYVEIKRERNQFKQKKIVLFQEQYPHIKFKLLWEKDLIEMGIETNKEVL